MDFVAVNFIAIIVAAVAAFVFGAAWYMGLSKPWMAAARIDPSKGNRSIAPFIVSFISLLIMAYVMHVLIAVIAFGGMSVTIGLLTGFVCWLGFIATTIATNQRYQGYGWNLTIIDAIHWLGVALIIGAVIGWFGGMDVPTE